MSKQEINYLGLVSKVLKQARKDAEEGGEPFNQSKSMKSAAERWKVIKDGKDPEFIQGKGMKVTRKSKKTKSIQSNLKTKNSEKNTNENILKVIDDLCPDCRDKVKVAMNIKSMETKSIKTKRRSKKIKSKKN